MKVKNTWLIATVIGSLEGISLEFFVYTIEEYSKLQDQIHQIDGIEKLDKHIYTGTFREDYDWGTVFDDEV